MNKFLVGAICLLLGFLLGGIIAWFILSGGSKPAPIMEAIDTPSASVTENERDAQSYAPVHLAIQAVELIKAGDFASLAEMVHPDYGVTFSPYTTINLNSALCFTSEEVAGFADNTSSYTWGIYDDSNSAIEMTPAEYFSAFVFANDYTQAPVLSINNTIATGNALENTSEAFPGAQFIEFHYPSTASEKENPNWSTLRLIFEEYDGRYMLSGIVSSQWTI